METYAINTLVRREDLLGCFRTLQGQFDSSLQQARAQEHRFEVLRATFIERLTRHLSAARKGVPKHNPLHHQIMDFISLMEKTKNDWDNKIAGRKKGVEFREGFEDSLLVFVNGKVKSGKSSLGNYMAWGNTDPTDDVKSQVATKLRPEYFSHVKTNVKGGDKDNEAWVHREFRVGATEATSSIQGFSLPGLTWVDSPGLHSLNKENEMLARDYVEHADLILYTMKSDSPGRESDLAEIIQLFNKGKRILLLLTGSDDIEEDFDEGSDTLVQTVVMKDQARRARQRDYVRTALKETCSVSDAENVEIVSFSARYAQMHADDPEAFVDSGMGHLCEALATISMSDGVRIKQATPMINLRNFLDNCRTDLAPYEALIQDFRNPLDELKQRSQKRLIACIRDGQGELAHYVDHAFQKMNLERQNSNTVADLLAAFQSDLNAKLSDIAIAQLGIIFNELVEGFQSAVRTTYINSTLLQLPEFKLEKIKEKTTVVRGGTRARNSSLGSLVGGVVGFFLGGGPAGAMVGASLGGAAGGMSGDSARAESREIEVTVGDNLQEIQLQAIRGSQRALETQMRSSAEELWSSIDLQVEGVLTGLSKEIQDFNRQLQALLLQTTSSVEPT